MESVGQLLSGCASPFRVWGGKIHKEHNGSVFELIATEKATATGEVETGWQNHINGIHAIARPATDCLQPLV